MTENPNLPDNLTETGRITVRTMLGSEGTGTAFESEGVSTEAAIGYLTVVIDRLRDQAAANWDQDTEPIIIELECPHCNETFVIGDVEHEEGDE